MEQHFLAPALTEDEKVFLYQQRNSEHYRVFSKAITYLYSLEAARMVHAKPDELLQFQGKGQGLLLARSLLHLGKIQE